VYEKGSPLTRRAFIGGIGALPVFLSSATAEETLPPSRLFHRDPLPIASAEQVLNVSEFESLARVALPPAHFGYIATGADDDRTVLCNQEAFSHYAIRARRFNDILPSAAPSRRLTRGGAHFKTSVRT
jgi:hypothetical protein